MLRDPGRIPAWLAIAAMTLNALWPLLANAKPAVPANPSEICSATGLKHTGGEPAGAPDQGSHPSCCSHCPHCPFNAERGAAIPCVAAPSCPTTAGSRPEFAGTSRFKSQLDPATRPRAPPVLS